MFRKNDKSLINARWITLTCIILLLIAAVAAGVVLCALAFDQTILEGLYGEGAPPVDLTLFISGIVIILVSPSSVCSPGHLRTCALHRCLT